MEKYNSSAVYYDYHSRLFKRFSSSDINFIFPREMDQMDVLYYFFFDLKWSYCNVTWWSVQISRNVYHKWNLCNLFKCRINSTNGHCSKSIQAYEIFTISVFNLSKHEFQMHDDFERMYIKKGEREREKKRREKNGIISPIKLLLRGMLSFTSCKLYLVSSNNKYYTCVTYSSESLYQMYDSVTN